jgi:hypothetical protein
VTSKEDDVSPKSAPKVDPDSMSAPDQLEVQQLQSQRYDAEARGDKRAVKDIDARLAQLTNPK